jgi:hypothetical protein
LVYDNESVRSRSRGSSSSSSMCVLCVPQIKSSLTEFRRARIRLTRARAAVALVVTIAGWLAAESTAIRATPPVRSCGARARGLLAANGRGRRRCGWRGDRRSCGDRRSYGRDGCHGLRSGKLRCRLCSRLRSSSSTLLCLKTTFRLKESCSDAGAKRSMLHLRLRVTQKIVDHRMLATEILDVLAAGMHKERVTLHAHASKLKREVEPV